QARRKDSTSCRWDGTRVYRGDSRRLLTRESRSPARESASPLSSPADPDAPARPTSCSHAAARRDPVPGRSTQPQRRQPRSPPSQVPSSHTSFASKILKCLDAVIAQADELVDGERAPIAIFDDAQPRRVYAMIAHSNDI